MRLKTRELLYSFLAAFIALIIIASLTSHPYLSLGLFVLISILINYLLSWRMLKFFLIAVFIGFVGEAFVVNFGAWSYLQNPLLGLPYWIPLMWGLVAIFFVKLHAFIQTETDK